MFIVLSHEFWSIFYIATDYTNSKLTQNKGLIFVYP